MAIPPEALDIILRLQGVPTYVSGMSAASDANKEFADSQKAVSAASAEQAASQDKLLGTAALVNKTLTGTGLALAAAAIEGFKWSIQFNKQLEMIHTQAGASQKEVNSFRSSILALSESGKVTQMPKELAEGLYHLVSVGLRGPAAMKALEIAAKGAAVGGAHLEDVTTALGAAWIVGAKGAGNLHNVMGILNATVGAGNLRMEELVQSLGSGIIPVSKIAHLSIQDIGAALATLSDSGYNASSGMAQLGTSLHFLYDPSTKAKKALESIGLTQSQLFKEMSGPNGLHGALELLKNSLASIGGPAEQAEKLGEILPGGRGKVLLTLMEELERLETKKKDIIAHSGEFDSDVTKTMEQPANRIAAAWSGFHAVLIRVGEAIEGPGTAALVGMMKVLGGVFMLILALTDHGKLLVPIILAMAGAWGVYKAAVIATSIAQLGWAAIQAGIEAAAAAEIVGIDGLAAAFVGLSVAMDVAGFGLVLLAITAVIAGIYLLITHFRAVVAFLRGPWGTAALLILAPFIALPVEAALRFNQLKNIFSGIINWIKKEWGKLGSTLASPFEWLWAKVMWVANKMKGVLSPNNLIHAAIGSIPLVGGALSSITPHFAEGGVMPYSGMAMINENGPGETVWLPGGSSVTPSSSSSIMEARSHTPTPAPAGEGNTFNIEAWLELPTGAGRTMYQLITRETTVKEART